MGFTIFFILAVVLNALDYFLTKSIIDHVGRELNPIIKKFGMIPMKAITLVAMGVIGYFKWVVLIPCDIIILGVCVWNFTQYRKIMG